MTCSWVKTALRCLQVKSTVLAHWRGGDDNGDVTEVFKCHFQIKRLAMYLKFKQFRGLMGISTCLIWGTSFNDWDHFKCTH